MKKKIAIFCASVLGIFIIWIVILTWDSKRVDAEGNLIELYHQQIERISSLFVLSTIVQQQQTQIRHGLIKDVNPVIDNVLEIEKTVMSSENFIARSSISRSCRECHPGRRNYKWRDVKQRLDDLKTIMNKYKLQFSEFITTSNLDIKKEFEIKGIESANDLVKRTSGLYNLFSAIEKHITARLYERQRQVVYDIFILSVLGFAAIIFLFYLFIRGIIDPIQKLENAARILSAGGVPDRIQINTGDVFEHVASAFNQMVESINRISTERERLLKETQEFNQLLERRVESDRKKLEMAHRHLARNEKLSALGTLAAGVSHEISNPIHIILGICSILSKKAQPESELATDIQMIEGEASRCQSIVTSLLDFARERAPEKMLSDINKLIDETAAVMRLQKDKKNIRFETDLADDLPKIWIDIAQIKQVFLNLYINAVHAMPQGGRVLVRSQKASNNGTPSLLIVVEDSGTGIAPEILPKIFDPFFSTKKAKRGTGLGLAISSRIIEDHGGRIEVDSQLGKGTIFAIMLPIDNENNSRKPIDQG